MAIMQSVNLPNLMPENAPLSALSAVIGRKLAFTRLLPACSLPSRDSRPPSQRKLYRYLTHFIQNVASQFIYVCVCVSR
jgi:hypothetical protein